MLEAKVWLFNALADIIEYIGKLPATIVDVATVATPALKGLALAFSALAEGARGWAEIYYTLRSLDLSKQITEMKNLASAVPEQSAEFLKKADDLLKQKEEVDARLSQLAAAPSLMQTVAAWDGIERGIAGAKNALDKANIEGRFKGIADSLRSSAQEQTLISGLEKLGSEIGDNYDWIRGLDKTPPILKKSNDQLEYFLDGERKVIGETELINNAFTALKQSINDDTAAIMNLKNQAAALKKIAVADQGYQSFTPSEEGYKKGGVIYKKQTGGAIPGGFGGGDRVPAMLEAGEFVMRKEAVRSLGVDTLAALNRGGGLGEQKGYFVLDLRAGGKSFPVKVVKEDVADALIEALRKKELIQG